MDGHFHLTDLFETVARTLPARLAGYKVSKWLICADEVRCSPAGKQDCHWVKELAATAS
jgi:hypothetical protein